NSGGFGPGWSWVYGTRAVAGADGSVAVIEASGRRSLFFKNGATWTAAAAVNATLAAVTGGGYAVTRHDQSVWTFAADGRLLSIADRNGNTHTLNYTGTRLTGVTAPESRTLTLTYDGSGHIT